MVQKLRKNSSTNKNSISNKTMTMNTSIRWNILIHKNVKLLSINAKKLVSVPLPRPALPPLIASSDLYHKYHENFAKPQLLPPDQVFTYVSFLVKTPDNKVASTELCGCVPIAEHLLATGIQKKQTATGKDEADCEENEGEGSSYLLPFPLCLSSTPFSPLSLCLSLSLDLSLFSLAGLTINLLSAAIDNLRKGNWTSRLKDLLPGDKFEDSRAEIRQVLAKVENLLDETTKGVNLFRNKCHIYLYYKRQCQAYQHLIQEGITTEKGDKHMNEYEHWKGLVDAEIEKMFQDLLANAFAKG
jgi:hypothetical protein